MADARLARPLWRGRTNVDALTISVIERAEKALGRQLVVTQGSYQAGAGDPNSAGTHDKGGVVDISTRGMTAEVKRRTELELRKAGGFASIRTPAQGPWPEHIHMAVVDHPLLSADAAAQVREYRAGGDGLKGSAKDTGPRLSPIPVPVWPVIPPKPVLAAAWSAAKKRLGVREGVTVNDDFTDRHSDVPEILRARKPMWVGVQEGKREKYAALLLDEFGAGAYDVTQRMTTEATQGVAVIVDLDQAHPVGDAVDNPRALGRGYDQLTPAGHGILARGVVWRDVVVLGPGRRRRLVRLASTHRQPERADAMWPAFDRALDAWLAASPIPVWLTADFNTERPATIRTRGRKRLHGIDGHLITGRLRFVALLTTTKRRTSDHRGVAALVHVPRQAA